MQYDTSNSLDWLSSPNQDLELVKLANQGTVICWSLLYFGSVGGDWQLELSWFDYGIIRAMCETRREAAYHGQREKNNCGSGRRNRSIGIAWWSSHSGLVELGLDIWLGDHSLEVGRSSGLAGYVRSFLWTGLAPSRCSVGDHLVITYIPEPLL